MNDCRDCKLALPRKIFKCYVLNSHTFMLFLIGIFYIFIVRCIVNNAYIQSALGYAFSNCGFYAIFFKKFFCYVTTKSIRILVAYLINDLNTLLGKHLLNCFLIFSLNSSRIIKCSIFFNCVKFNGGKSCEFHIKV